MEATRERRVKATLARPLTAIKSTYFFVYAVDGAILPFLALFLRQEHGMDAARIGTVLAVSAAAGVFAPPLFTLLADRKGNARELFMALLAISALALGLFAVAENYWWLLLCFTLFGIAREPTRPLLDGIFFSASRAYPAMESVRFHNVRIWGTAGFMVPGIILFFAVGATGDSLAFLPFVAAGLAFATLPAARLLPRPPSANADDPRASLLRTARAALRVIRRPDLGVFMGAMFVLQVGVTAYLAYYPLQMAEVGLANRWIGPLTTLGVALELVYMAAFGWLVRKLGWRWFMVAGASTAVLRMIALAIAPGVVTLIGTQVVHGFLIVVTMVGARALLDQYADDGVRYSMQGMYAMLVLGGGRVVGNALGGWVADHSLSTLFAGAAAISVVAIGMLIWALRPVTPIGSST